MTQREAAIITAYTEIFIGDFPTLHVYAEELLQRKIQVGEFQGIEIWKELKEKSKEDFLKLHEKVKMGKGPEEINFRLARQAQREQRKDDLEFIDSCASRARWNSYERTTLERVRKRLAIRPLVLLSILKGK